MHLETDAPGNEGEDRRRRKQHLGERGVMEELGDFLQEFPVLGFNSGKYDINLNQATPVFETSEMTLSNSSSREPPSTWR